MPTQEQLKGTFISSPAVFNKMLRYGWINGSGRSMRWFDHQKRDHNDQFQEARERKEGKKKFKKKER